MFLTDNVMVCMSNFWRAIAPYRHIHKMYNRDIMEEHLLSYSTSGNRLGRPDAVAPGPCDSISGTLFNPFKANGRDENY